jgi:hypothetical protein
MAIKLGDRVKDRTTGFTGIVLARTDWLYGCTVFGVKPEELKDGLPMDMQWFDEQSVDACATEPGGPGVSGGPSVRAGQ